MHNKQQNITCPWAPKRNEPVSRMVAATRDRNSTSEYFALTLISVIKQ